MSTTNEEKTAPEHSARRAFRSPTRLEDTSAKAPSVHSDESSAEALEAATRYPDRPVTVGVRYYNYEAFMSRAMGDEGDYVIEVLVAQSDPDMEASAERSRRREGGERNPRAHSSVEKFGDDRHLQLVRIRSKPIFSRLSSLTGIEYSIDKASCIFPRPFAVFRHYHEYMKKELTKMEREDTTEAEIALQHMRLYVQFVEDKILPLHLQYRAPNSTRARCMIRYEDIPLLFRPGELVYHHPRLQKGKTLHRTAVQTVWRLVECRPADYPAAESRSVTLVKIYYLDYDGEKLVPIWYDITFEYFPGMMDVTTLPCFPLEYHSDQVSIRKEKINTGKMFKDVIGRKVQHLYYSGWTFVTGVLAEALEDDKGVEIQHPDYIESEVVVDLEEAIRSFPAWQTESDSEPDLDEWSWRMTDRVHGVDFWVYTGNTEVPLPFTEPLFSREDRVYGIERAKYIEEDVFIREEVDPANYKWKDDDLALLPKRVVGYVLRERRFSRLDVTGIQDNLQNKTTLDDIEMDEGHRSIIRSAILSHFKAQKHEKELGVSTFNLDAIRGKGKGLTILLHGAPGVGKTATAEAVAIETDKPLLPITCGDLGTKPEVVDKTLRDIFRYAHKWECILLLDEADVFLTKRELNSLERNALVGVFLRVLEYYRGVLFLTTNRVGALDEAFQSRVHVSLWYPYLTLERTLRILGASLKRLPQPSAADAKPVYGLVKVMDKEILDFVKEEYNKYSQATGKKRGPWNGRQIRNAVQVAACLALYEKETEDKKDDYPAVLTATHFKRVAETTSKFENFLKATRTGDDAYWAQALHYRADDWGDEEDEYDEFEDERLVSARKPRQPLDRRLSIQSGGASTSARKQATPPTSARSLRHPPPQSIEQFDSGDDRSDEYKPSTRSRRDVAPATSPSGRPSGKMSRRPFPDEGKHWKDARDMQAEEEGHFEQWAPNENKGAWRGPSTPIHRRGRVPRENDAQFTSPRRDNRAAGGYS